MSSNFGFRPHDLKTGATGVFSDLNDMVVYSAPSHLLTATSISTAGNTTLTPAAVLGGLILRDAAGGNRTDTLPSAAQIVAAFNGCVVGSAIRFIVRNTTSTSNTVTIATPASITNYTGNTLEISQSKTAEFIIMFSNVTSGSEAATLYTISSDNTH